MPPDAASVRILPRPIDVAAAIADAVAEAIAERPALVVSLATGRTPLLAYQELAERRRSGRFDASRARLLGIDEFAGTAPSHPGSFGAYIDRYLVAPLGFDPAHVERLDGAAADLHLECLRYERVIDARGGIDLMLLGIGANGHIAFNEPADALTGPTHVVRLDESTKRDNARRFGGDITAVPTHALTMGMATILRARRIILVATGAEKAASVEHALHGPLTTRLPASWLQTHRAVDVFLDREAASLLRTPGTATLRAG